MYCPAGTHLPWGVIDATFEPESLKLGRLQARHLHVRFQDGTLIDTDNADSLPPVLSLESQSQEVTVMLALPLLRANGGNCLKPDEVAECPVRYRQRWRDVRNAYGEDTRQIAVMQPELTLCFAHQNNSDYLTCPVARLEQDSQGAWQLDETFLPPLLTIQGSRWLVTQLEQLMTQLRARLCRLMAMRRESNERMADFAVADVSLFWLLNALNSAEPVLGQFQRNLQNPPERLYPELSRLAGSLLTFSLEHQVNAIPVWHHEQLNAVFPPLFDLLGDLLEASLPSRVVALTLDYDPRLHFWQARLHDPRLRKERITIFLYGRRYRWRSCRNSSRASVRSAVLTMCGNRQLIPRGCTADAAASCASRHSAAPGKSVFQSRPLASFGGRNAPERDMHVLRPGHAW